MIARICSLIRMRIPKTVDRGFLSGSGESVPPDGADGWQTGSFFQKTLEASGSVLFVNIGSVESSVFRQVLLYDPG